MSFEFSNSAPYRFESGALFLGLDEQGQEIGVKTERHAITIAGSRAGKGAALIVPNLLRWPGNVLCIDPAGENIEATWQAREAMGQKVRVLDPFHEAKIPERLRASCNLLAGISPDDRRAAADIEAIAESLVIRFEPKHGQWDEGARAVLAGLIAFVIAEAPPEDRNLASVRDLLTQPPEVLEQTFRAMAESADPTGLIHAAASIGLSPVRINQEYVAGARENSKWLSKPAFREALGNGFELSELKTAKTDVFLVLPMQYLATEGRFLRVFVQAALDAMTKGGKNGARCLFLLDEFFSLGHMTAIHKAAGGLPKYGVHLWPFLQDLGQLVSVYEPEGAETFSANADAQIFFGNTDNLTLERVSLLLGLTTQDDIGIDPPERSPDPIDEDEYLDAHKPQGGLSLGNLLRGPRPGESQFSTGALFRGGAMVGGMFYQGAKARGQAAKQFDIQQRRDAQAVEDENARREYDHAMRALNSPRVPPKEVRELVAKRDGDKVARSMIVFAKGGDVLNLRLAPYFEKREPRPEARQADASARTGTGAELPAVITEAQRKLRGARMGLECGARSIQEVKTAKAGRWLLGAVFLGVAAWMFGQKAGAWFFGSGFGFIVCGVMAFIEYQDIGAACERARQAFAKNKREAEQTLMRFNKQYGGKLLD